MLKPIASIAKQIILSDMKKYFADELMQLSTKELKKNKFQKSIYSLECSGSQLKNHQRT
jgi:hypothetical protein